jgi:hypothetical protein
MDDEPPFGDPPEPKEPSPFDDEAAFEYDEEDLDEGEPVTAGRPAVPAVRHESLQQRENFASTGTFVLHNGKKVRVTGRTFLIHGKTKKPRVKLQLAKEKRTKYIIPPWETADGRIALEGDEVENLYARLTEARQNLGERTEADYLVVKTGADPELSGLEALLRMVGENPEHFLPLATMVAAGQLDALHALTNVGRFRRARDELAQMVEDNPPEVVFQHWFEENDWVFGTEYIERLTKPRHIAPDSIIDLMFLAVDGFVDVFELKRPRPDVFVPHAPGYYIPSPDLNEAFGQAVHYLAEADNMGFFNKEVRHVPFYRPRVRLVIGRSKDWTEDHYRVYRETTTAWNRVELLTYDMVLLRIDLFIKTMLRELRQKTTEAAPEVREPPAAVHALPDDDTSDLDDLPF